MINCGQFIRKEVRNMFRNTGIGQNMMCCRMLISRACSVAETFGLLAARKRMNLRG